MTKTPAKLGLDDTQIPYTILYFTEIFTIWKLYGFIVNQTATDSLGNIDIDNNGRNRRRFTPKVGVRPSDRLLI